MNQIIKNNLLIIVTVITGIVFATFVAPFLTWTFLALMVAMALRPLQHGFFVKRLKLSKSVSVYGLLLIILLFFIPFVFSFISVFSNIKEQVSNLNASESLTSVEMLIDKLYSKVDAFGEIVEKEQVIEYTRQGIEKMATQLIATVSHFFKQLPKVLLSLFFFCASLFYFISDARKIKKFLADLKFIKIQDLERLLKIVQSSCQSTLFAALLTGLTQGLIVALPAKILGFHYFISTFFITFFLSQIPLVGITPATVFIVGYFYVNDNIAATIIMLIAGILGGVADNIVRIWFLSRYDSLHPLAGLFAALGGLVILGPLGVLIGPVLTMIFFKLLKTEFMQKPSI